MTTIEKLVQFGYKRCLLPFLVRVTTILSLSRFLVVVFFVVVCSGPVRVLQIYFFLISQSLVCPHWAGVGQGVKCAYLEVLLLTASGNLCETRTVGLHSGCRQEAKVQTKASRHVCGKLADKRTRRILKGTERRKNNHRFVLLYNYRLHWTAVTFWWFLSEKNVVFGHLKCLRVICHLTFLIKKMPTLRLCNFRVSFESPLCQQSTFMSFRIRVLKRVLLLS